MGKAILSAIVLIGVLLLSGCQSSAPAIQPPATTSPASQPAPAQTTTDTSQTASPPPTTSQATSPKPTTASPPPAPTIPIGVSIGNRAPDFQLQTLTGDSISLWGLRGKPVLINFWATWCPPCKAEMPYLQQIHDTYSAKGLVLLAIDIGEKTPVVEKFMTDLNLSMIVPMDTDAKVAKAYLIGAIPTTFLIDKDGVIRQKVIGAFPNVAAIENELKKIMP